VTLANGTSTKVEDRYTHPPWLSSYGGDRWLGFRDWCLSLARGPRLWEAQKIFNLLLPVLSAVDASELYLELQEAFRRHQARYRLSILQSTAYTLLGQSQVEILSIFLQRKEGCAVSSIGSLAGAKATHVGVCTCLVPPYSVEKASICCMPLSQREPMTLVISQQWLCGCAQWMI
jgi:hypothetical protein